MRLDDPNERRGFRSLLRQTLERKVAFQPFAANVSKKMECTRRRLPKAGEPTNDIFAIYSNPKEIATES
jgi:hypothetical protein